MPHLIDSDALMSAHRRYYRFENFPSVWSWLEEQFKKQSAASVENVLQEIKKGRTDDPLRKWAEKNKKYFLPTQEAETQEAMREILEYVQGAYSEQKLTEFLAGADIWLIAKAKALADNGVKNTVVTNEDAIYNPGMNSRITIPNVCTHFNIRTLTFFDFLSTLNAKF